MEPSLPPSPPPPFQPNQSTAGSKYQKPNLSHDDLKRIEDDKKKKTKKSESERLFTKFATLAAAVKRVPILAQLGETNSQSNSQSIAPFLATVTT